MLQRAAIALLVVLNLGAAAWWWLHARPAAEAAVAAPAGAARLHLVSESSLAAQAAGAPAAARPALRADASAEAPSEAAAAPPGTARATACEGTGPASAWRVWLPRLPSLDVADATAARIAEAGFSDYLVVRDGADANTIALGRYGTEQAAQRRTAALRASGFPARCARIPPATPA